MFVNFESKLANFNVLRSKKNVLPIGKRSYLVYSRYHTSHIERILLLYQPYRNGYHQMARASDRIKTPKDILENSSASVTHATRVLNVCLLSNPIVKVSIGKRFCYLRTIPKNTRILVWWR